MAFGFQELDLSVASLVFAPGGEGQTGKTREEVWTERLLEGLGEDKKGEFEKVSRVAPSPPQMTLGCAADFISLWLNHSAHLEAVRRSAHRRSRAKGPPSTHWRCGDGCCPRRADGSHGQLSPLSPPTSSNLDEPSPDAQSHAFLAGQQSRRRRPDARARNLRHFRRRSSRGLRGSSREASTRLRRDHQTAQVPLCPVGSVEEVSP